MQDKNTIQWDLQWSPDIELTVAELKGDSYPNSEDTRFVWESNYIPIEHYSTNMVLLGPSTWMRYKMSDTLWSSPIKMVVTGRGIKSIDIEPLTDGFRFKIIYTDNSVSFTAPLSIKTSIDVKAVTKIESSAEVPNTLVVSYSNGDKEDVALTIIGGGVLEWDNASSFSEFYAINNLSTIGHDVTIYLKNTQNNYWVIDKATYSNIGKITFQGNLNGKNVIGVENDTTFDNLPLLKNVVLNVSSTTHPLVTFNGGVHNLYLQNSKLVAIGSTIAPIEIQNNATISIKLDDSSMGSASSGLIHKQAGNPVIIRVLALNHSIVGDGILTGFLKLNLVCNKDTGVPTTLNVDSSIINPITVTYLDYTSITDYLWSQDISKDVDLGGLDGNYISASYRVMNRVNTLRLNDTKFPDAFRFSITNNSDSPFILDGTNKGILFFDNLNNYNSLNAQQSHTFTIPAAKSVDPLYSIVYEFVSIAGYFYLVSPSTPKIPVAVEVWDIKDDFSVFYQSIVNRVCDVCVIDSTDQRKGFIDNGTYYLGNIRSIVSLKHIPIAIENNVMFQGLFPTLRNVSLLSEVERSTYLLEATTMTFTLINASIFNTGSSIPLFKCIPSIILYGESVLYSDSLGHEIFELIDPMNGYVSTNGNCSITDRVFKCTIPGRTITVNQYDIQSTIGHIQTLTNAVINVSLQVFSNKQRYDNSSSGLESTTIQTAIDELASKSGKGYQVIWDNDLYDLSDLWGTYNLSDRTSPFEIVLIDNANNKLFTVDCSCDTTYLTRFVSPFAQVTLNVQDNMSFTSLPDLENIDMILNHSAGSNPLCTLSKDFTWNLTKSSLINKGNLTPIIVGNGSAPSKLTINLYSSSLLKQLIGTGAVNPFQINNLSLVKVNALESFVESFQFTGIGNGQLTIIYDTHSSIYYDQPITYKTITPSTRNVIMEGIYVGKNCFKGEQLLVNGRVYISTTNHIITTNSKP